MSGGIIQTAVANKTLRLELDYREASMLQKDDAGIEGLADLPKPSLDQVPNGRGVLVKVLRVGVDGTDKEINAAEYGAAPPGYDFLVIRP